MATSFFSSSEKGDVSANSIEASLAAQAANRLTVRVLGASGFTFKGDLSDSTCKIRIEGQKFRTKIAKRSANPVWDEEFVFFITNPQSAVAVQIHHKELIGRTLLAQLVIPIQNIVNGEDDYEDKWFDMVKPTNATTNSSLAKITEPKVRLGFTYREGSRPTISIKDFEILAVIGRGAFGKVFQVRKKDSGKIYAMKTMRKRDIIEKGIVDYSRAELKVLQSARHPFLNGLIFSFHNEDKVFLVTEYLNGGDLFFHLNEQGRFSDEQTRFYTAELILALEYLHQQNIVYRDLKPENILLSRKGHVVLTDFGFAKRGVATGAETYTICGTPDYMAPEMLLRQGYSLAVDWWCLGVLVYEMLTGEHPFTGATNQEMYRKIVTIDPVWPRYLSPEGLDLVKKLMCRDPAQRLGANGAAEVKAHPFFKDVDWERLFNRQVKPPFKPRVKNDKDVANMDPLMASEATDLTPPEENAIGKSAEDHFEGFEFVDPEYVRTDIERQLTSKK